MPEAILIATGFELGLAMAAANEFKNKNRAVRMVSMPPCDVFDARDLAYRQSVLPAEVTTRVAVLAGHRDLWYKYVGLYRRHDHLR